MLYCFLIFAFILLAGCTSTQNYIVETNPTTGEIVALQNEIVEKELGLTGFIVSGGGIEGLEGGGVMIECEKKTIHYVSYKFNELSNDYYKSYTNAPKFCFAFRLTIDGAYYGYLNVFRNKNGGVSNDPKLGLTGCTAGMDIVKYEGMATANANSFTIVEGETYAFAKNDGYGYEYKTIPFGIKEIVAKDSGVKEGVDLFDIGYYKEEICE